MSSHDRSSTRGRPRRRRFDDEHDPADDAYVSRRRRRSTGPTPPPAELDGRAGEDVDGPPEGDRWSTWDGADNGPQPRPDWVVTATGAVDTELGVLKTGKEADVHLLHRGVPGEPGTLLAAKRYRSSEHRMFHRDSGYLQGRRVRRSRETRAMASRSDFGRDLLAGQWARAEFAALSTLWSAGVPVPYPVSVDDTEVLLEFIGDGESAAPRLAQLRPGADELADLWRQLGEALRGLARHGLTHGDLSAFNLLVHRGRLVMIDLPQVVDVVGNPFGPSYLGRDVDRVAEWFAARGLPDAAAAQESLLADLMAELGITGPGTSHP
ncbi:RIO kinase 1 [Pseudonocardia sulfidoxydans NBRC 16205]|uniref:non-specific serine/threonine protein kinase n=1 Tax=Pseudonocardia sulfidoxydans NBRC 16205 TaxID=1223511 RepID=A0A511DP48_9PSEU|nr:RIO1 family regulatory kinase/ATPase [Pseudonocardia sulfidoxydans]GEL26590.1 RIO kinase 1 [Pseudonocardia sulfidoxydans NBRC 16205]